MKCKFCNQSKLDWVDDGGGYKLYDPMTGEIHRCDAAKKFMGKIPRACRHGIAKDRWCDLCAAESRGE